MLFQRIGEPRKESWRSEVCLQEVETGCVRMNPVSFEKRRGSVAYYAQITASMTAPASGF
jgi:hypothetical protein